MLLDGVVVVNAGRGGVCGLLASPAMVGDVAGTAMQMEVDVDAGIVCS